MTVHAVRIKTSEAQEDNPDFVPKPEPPELANVLPQRVEDHIKYNFNPVLENQDSPMAKKTSSQIDNHTQHVTGEYRFSVNDDKTSLLDSIESKVAADAKWYKVEYHECDHDTEGESNCNWKTERTKGSVPGDL